MPPASDLGVAAGGCGGDNPQPQPAARCSAGGVGQPRLILADENRLLLDALSSILRSNFEIVEIVTDGRAAVEAAKRLRPNLLLADLSLPLLNGIETTRRVRQAVLETKVVFVTMRSDRVSVEDAFRAGGAGYVLKQAGLGELMDAISSVLAGRSYLSSGISVEVGRLDVRQRRRDTAGGLTNRQREILQLIAEGKTMKEMAWILKLSIRTVEFHKQSLFEDLGLRTTAQLIRYALDQRIAF